MVKIKKYVCMILIVIASILGFSTISKGYEVGQEIGVSYWQYEASNNIFCLEHGQNLVDTVYYKIISHVKIDGNQSTDHEGKTINSWYNAKMAGILASDASKEEKKNATCKKLDNGHISCIIDEEDIEEEDQTTIQHGVKYEIESEFSEGIDMGMPEIIIEYNEE